MDIKQILKDKINALFDERKPLVEEFEQYHTYVKYPDITKLNGEIQAYTDCANLIEQSEKPMKVIDKQYDALLHREQPIGDIGYCPNCHSCVDPEDKFCRECGQPLDWGEGEKK